MQATRPRQLLVIADDFGIGANTTTGILQLAARGIVTGSVLLVNCPDAPFAVQKWRQLGSTLEIGWHPNLTLDAPIAPVGHVPSLVRANGTFLPLGAFLKRWFLGLLDPREIQLELLLQWQRFIDLVGHPPTFVNCHQHIGLFAPIGEILLEILKRQRIRPYIRRIQEPWTVVRSLPGARLKRCFLGWLGRRLSRIQEAQGFPGNDWLAGITSPPCVENARFFTQWLQAMPGQIVELMCHPGRLDASLVGRDCGLKDGLLQQRVNELRWLREPSFSDAVTEAGFRLAPPSQFVTGSQVWAKSA